MLNNLNLSDLSEKTNEFDEQQNSGLSEYSDAPTEVNSDSEDPSDNDLCQINEDEFISNFFSYFCNYQ